jgi:hypothetical protein
MDDMILEYIEKSKGPIYMTASAVVEEMIEFHSSEAIRIIDSRDFHMGMVEFWKRVVIETPVWTDNGMLRYITDKIRDNKDLILKVEKI